MANNDNINKLETPAAEELLKKIQELEVGHAHLKREISKLMIAGDQKNSDRQRSNTCQPNRQSLPSSHESNTNISGGAVEPTESQYKNILQSLGQSVHLFDLTGHIIYWSKTAQNLYGYTFDEVVGRTVADVIIEYPYSTFADLIIQRAVKGESWSGEFPVRNKRWERFTVITTVSPLLDENGNINAVTCISSYTRPYQEARSWPSVGAPRRIASAHQPLQNAIVSKMSNLASKVKSKIKTGENIDNEGGSGDDRYPDMVPCVHKEDALLGGEVSPPFCVFSSTGKPTTDYGGENENKPGIHKVLSSKAEAWMGKKGISWPWKGNEREGGRFGWPWSHNDQDEQMSSCASTKEESYTNEASGPWSSSFSASSSGSTIDNVISKMDMDVDTLDYEISWDDLTVGERIGQGLCGTVYHASWYGSDVAVKVFSEQEYPDDVIFSFRQEVSLMKRLRHPNILLFMGAVTSPQHLCIVTEFLPRGSLFQLLQRNPTKLDWRRRVHMAIDIARGMNYLHNCNPPIIHGDLKSSNLLVDKNWTIKVGDFGLSRIKHETYLRTKSVNGTPQWMAPDILCNEQADEKSDVYSYGVVLWELTTEKIPWYILNAMQVIGAEGFMNQQLEIPKGVDPEWVSLIESCWCREPQSRPTFKEVLNKLKDLQKKLVQPRHS